MHCQRQLHTYSPARTPYTLRETIELTYAIMRAVPDLTRRHALTIATDWINRP
jgi:hypothetical protein